MHSTDGRERRSRLKGGSVVRRGARRRSTARIGRRSRGLLAAGLATLGLGALAPSAGAAEPVSFPGGPLTVSVGPLGQCQSSYPNRGNNFYPPTGNLGDCGLFLAFPTPSGEKFTGQPLALRGETYGFSGSAGPHLTPEYTPGSQSEVTGAGTAGSPYSQTTSFKVIDEGTKTEFAQIAEVIEYVNGAAQFTSTYSVKNTSLSTIYFRAMYAGDLYLLGNDFGTGVFLGGPPRFVGGQNPESGALGGLQEVTPWSAFEEACWNETPEGRCPGAAPTDAGNWHNVRSTVEEANAFNNAIDPALIDNGVGVEWDQYREAGLKPGEVATFSIINRTQVPSNLQISPVNQTLTQGQTATVNVFATDLAGNPYAGKVVHYTISGANPQTGTVTLNSAGQAAISYVGKNPGIDTDQLFVDLAGTGVQTPGDPAGAATATFVPLPPKPTPNSSYKIQSIKVNSDGTITIVFVPVQAGTATLEVTVPTGTIARHDATAAKKKCRRGQVRIKGKCRPKNTLTGRVTAKGLAGVALKLTVKASKKVKAALRKGRTVSLTAKLSYKSALGGAPTVKVFHFKVKAKRKHHH
jgi:hypothetical protein